VYQRIPGVLSTKVGYTQGHVVNPTYRQVCNGNTGHTEAIQLQFDPTVVTYRELLSVFWERYDHTTLNQQGNDVGTQYRSGVYYHSDEQKAVAEETKVDHEKLIGQRVVTEVLPAAVFFDAEDYHQQYLSKGGQCSDKGDDSPIRCYG
jgi:peptide-methionine (S)-S-oxide reductase